MNDSQALAETIFIGAGQLSDPQARAAYLDKACGDDRALRDQVDRMLAAKQRADQFLEEDPPGLNLSRPDPETVGTMIGPYKVLQQIGEGGCGIVYMAEQEEPIRRRVALKIIKLGMDTKQVIARFEAERQALAIMDHPNIARVLDAGTTDTGRPYFVMELVRGIRITDYCDQNNASTCERLDLFIKVAHAIQHAHLKGIIHRDIKPSNVLVTLHDGVPVPKVIDFGIAKALEQKLTDKTLFTQFEQFIGTPAYTSPEQAEMSGLDIDTRSDIYSLGVLLYELLVGQTPFDAHDLVHSGLDEMRRIIREKEPVRPSTRLSTMVQGEVTTTAQRRRASAPELIHLLKGDLDWIVMKCLEKDRTRRYETANGLGHDIQRYLSNEPVTARPPSQLYRLGKLARRNKVAFVAGTAVTLALVGGTIISTWQAVRAHRAEQVAKEEKESTEAVLRFVRDKILAAGRPEGQGGGLGKDVTLRQALDAAEAEIEKSFTNRPLVEAAIRKTLGESYRYLGEPRLAVEQLERAYTLRRETMGLDHEVTLSALNALQEAYIGSETPNQSLPLYEEMFKERKAKLGLEHNDTLTAMNNLGLAFMYADQHDRALPLLEETLRIRKAKLEPGHVSTLRTMHNLAAVYLALGQLQRGVTLCEETLALMRAKRGADQDGMFFPTMRVLVDAYRSVGKGEQAAVLAEEMFELAKARHGPEHPTTLRNMSESAYSYSQIGRHERALPLYEELLQLRKTKLGQEHPDTLIAMNNLSLAYSEAGKHDQAAALLEQTLQLRKAKLGKEHSQTLSTMNNLALAYSDSGKRDQAVKLFEETFELMRASLGANHGETLNTLANLVAEYGKAGKHAQALALAQEAVDLTKARRGPEHPATLRRMSDLGGAMASAGKLDEAVSLLETTFKLQTARLGPEHPETRRTAGRLGVAHLGVEKYDLALPLLQAGFQELKTKEGPDSFSTLRMLFNLAIATERATSGTLEQALPLYEETYKRMKATDHADTLVVMKNLAGAYRDAGKLDQAEEIFREILVRQNDSRTAALGLAGMLLERSRNDTNNPALARERAAEAERLARDHLARARVRYTNDAGNLEITLNGVAEVHYRLGNYAAAEPLYRESLQRQRARLNPEHRDVGLTTASLARTLADWAWAEHEKKSQAPNSKSQIVERAREAEQLLREGLALHLRGTNTSHWRVDDVKNRLGAALVSVTVTDPAMNGTARGDKLSEAETLLLDSNQHLQTSRSVAKKYKRDALERLVRLYEAWGRPNKRAEWQQKLEEFNQVRTASSSSAEQN